MTASTWVDTAKVMAFVKSTQPDIVERLGIGGDGPNREKFLDRLQGEITRRGVIEIPILPQPTALG
jgi:type I restriction enzyme R subunit